MKNDRQLRRLIAMSWLGLLAVVLGFVIWASLEIRDLRRTMNLAQERTASFVSKDEIETFKGLDGKTIIGPQGQPGQDGRDGRDGQNAFSTYSQTIVEKPTVIQTPVPGEKGDKGEPGERGLPGREIELGIQNGLPVYRYAGDLYWQLVEVVE